MLTLIVRLSIVQAMSETFYIAVSALNNYTSYINLLFNLLIKLIYATAT